MMEHLSERIPPADAVRRAAGGFGQGVLHAVPTAAGDALAVFVKLATDAVVEFAHGEVGFRVRAVGPRKDRDIEGFAKRLLEPMLCLDTVG